MGKGWVKWAPPVAVIVFGAIALSAFDCGSQEQANDRSVMVWLPAWQ